MTLARNKAIKYDKLAHTPDCAVRMNPPAAATKGTKPASCVEP